MAIYRGAGGAGDATTDTSIAVVTTLAVRAETAATTATTQAGNASSSASAAASSASAASGYNTSAYNNALNAAGYATSASNYANASAASYDAFDDRYLGAKASDPSTDNDGDALTTGALYYNTVSLQLKVYTGSTWAAAAVDASGFLAVANNLSDLNSASTARTNLGLGTAATTASTDYATAAQGALADSATQPGDNVSTLTNDAGYLTGITAQSIKNLSDVYSSMSPTDGQVLTYDTTNGWQAEAVPSTGLSNVVEDTTPQLGGALDTNGNNINFGDNEKATFGDSEDLWLYHDGTTSYLYDRGTGNLRIITNSTISIDGSSGGSFMATFVSGGAASFYHNNSKKLETTAAGATVTGEVTTTGGNSTNWQTAYSWGNHASAGYLNSTSTVDGGTY